MATVSIKEMPYQEKERCVRENLAMYRSFKGDFVHQHLGAKAAAELEALWEQSEELIPPGATAEAKYEITYANWIRQGKIANDFIKERLGEPGLAQLEDGEVEMLKQQGANPALYLLALIRALSPGRAFKMVAGRLAYELQWITPYQVTELGPDKFMADVPACKVLEHPGGEDGCHICQTVYPRWAAEQLRIDMVFNRQGHSCTLTAKPLS